MPPTELQRCLTRVLAEGPTEGALIAEAMSKRDLRQWSLCHDQGVTCRLHPRPHNEGLRGHPESCLEQAL